MPPDVEEKLWYEHEQLTQLDVEEALDALVESPRWLCDDEHGARVGALGRSARSGSGLLFIAIRPTGLPGSWELITAFACEEDYWEQLLKADDWG